MFFIYVYMHTLTCVPNLHNGFQITPREAAVMWASAFFGGAGGAGHVALARVDVGSLAVVRVEHIEAAALASGMG